MSRVIKFRAWDRATETMHHPGDNVWRLWLDGGVSIDGTWATGDVELLQFTGLSDNAGVDVFEGDIIKILQTDWPSKSDDDPRTLEAYLDSLTGIYEVSFIADKYGGARFTAIYDGEYHHSISCGTHGYIEVIGNIYQNPELLNRGN